MLNNIIEEEDDCFVFFYEEVDPEAHAILAELEGEQSCILQIFSVQPKFLLEGWLNITWRHQKSAKHNLNFFMANASSD